MILRILEAKVCGRYSLRLTFNDGTTKQVNVRPLLHGPIFEPLRDPSNFSDVALDPICGTVVWPNGADFAPEALYALEAEAPSESDSEISNAEIDRRLAAHNSNPNAAVPWKQVEADALARLRR